MSLGLARRGQCNEEDIKYLPTFGRVIFDWGRSRPLKMWRAFRPTDNEPVYWQFGWIEVFRDDVSGQFCGVEKTQATAPEKKRRGPGKKTARELVRRVIGQIYAGSLPESVSDKVVCGQVKEKFKELKISAPFGRHDWQSNSRH